MKTNLKMNVFSLLIVSIVFASVLVLTKQDFTERESCEGNKRFYFHGKCF